MPTIASSPSHPSADRWRTKTATPAAAPPRRRAGRSRRRAARPRGRATPDSRCSGQLPVTPARLGGYLDGCGRQREVVALGGRAGSLLVVDRDAATLADRHLVAHLATDEPTDNAMLVCRSYISHPDGRWCRRLRPGDLLKIPPGESPSASNGRRRDSDRGTAPDQNEPIASHGYVHQLRPIECERSIPELRWCRLGAAARRWQPVGLRAVIAALENYEPVRGITAATIARLRNDPQIALRQLCGEYRWLCTSPVVLNRALREAVLRAIDRDELSMSEIALRCGVLKRDRQGNRRGETSWLARRVGLMPEGGAKRTTPWIHSDVLALIAREGLRISP
ncbi:MAG TPA: hypothetical protein VHS55_06205, partial [Solirubrobacteraceae bacterium]|nr:hypothetical protein [Solirubrobacteraceae bacterium]